MTRRDPLSLLPEPGDPESLYVVDLSGFVWRTFKAHGQGPHAAVGFLKQVRRILRDRRPALLALVRDNPHPTFRHALFHEHAALLGAEGYKAERLAKQDPAERARGLEQCRLAEEMVEDAYGLSCHTARGYEGDDVVATLAQRGLDAGKRVVVVAHDKDMCQLVTTDSDRCVMWDGKHKVTDAEGVELKFGGRGAGCFPDRVAEYLAVVGDSVDGVKGIVGCGEVAALKLIRAFPSLREALASAQRGDGDHELWVKEPKLWAKVVHQQEQAKVCLRLVTLARDAPLSATLESVAAETRVAVECAIADQRAAGEPTGGEEDDQ